MRRDQISTLQPTRYEAVVTDGEQTYLLAYVYGTSGSKLDRCAAICGERIVELTGCAYAGPTKHGSFPLRRDTSTTDSGWVVRYTGRTQRDACAAGEYPTRPAEVTV